MVGVENSEFVPFAGFKERVDWDGVLEWLLAHPVEECL